MFTTFITVDPVSVLVGVCLGCVVGRCIFLIWKEKQDKLIANVLPDEQPENSSVKDYETHTK
jgi:hypothetical protein